MWLRTTSFGDDKDRVLIRSDGEPTYFAADIAYHLRQVRARGRAPDRSGRRRPSRLRPPDAGRRRGAGHDPNSYEAPLIQLVHLVEGGERARMSKRKGEFATLDELIDDIGVDAARFFMLQRSHDTTVDLDLDLARASRRTTPSTTSSTRTRASRASCARPSPRAAPPAWRATPSPRTRLLWPRRPEGMRLCSPPPSRLSAPSSSGCWSSRSRRGASAERRAPHRLAAYATATAADFHAFYRDCQVVGAGRGHGGRPGWASAWRRSA